MQGHNLLHPVSILTINLRQRYHASILWIHLGHDSVKLPDGLVLQQLVQEDLEVGIRDNSQVLGKHEQHGQQFSDSYMRCSSQRAPLRKQ